MKKTTNKFRDRLKEVKEPSAVAVIFFLTAISLLLTESLTLPLGNDIRVSFSFVGIMTIGMLYGSLPCMISAAAVEFAGYLAGMTKFSAANFAAQIIAAMLYGVLLYRKNLGSTKLFKPLEELFPSVVVNNIEIAARGILTRMIIVFFGNTILNSAFIFRSYSGMTSGYRMGRIFSSLRTDMTMLPFECSVILFVLPAAYILYEHIIPRLSGLRP